MFKGIVLLLADLLFVVLSAVLFFLGIKSNSSLAIIFQILACLTIGISVFFIFLFIRKNRTIDKECTNRDVKISLLFAFLSFVFATIIILFSYSFVNGFSLSSILGILCGISMISFAVYYLSKIKL